METNDNLSNYSIKDYLLMGHFFVTVLCICSTFSKVMLSKIYCHHTIIGVWRLFVCSTTPLWFMDLRAPNLAGILNFITQ